LEEKKQGDVSLKSFALDWLGSIISCVSKINIKLKSRPPLPAESNNIKEFQDKSAGSIGFESADAVDRLYFVQRAIIEHLKSESSSDETFQVYFCIFMYGVVFLKLIC
jgi:hypothetical protein